MTDEPTQLPQPRDARRPYRICLVCMGNICRSPSIEVLLRAAAKRAGLGDAVRLDSAGTGGWHAGQPMDRRARQALAGRGHDGSSHRARRFEAADFADRDLILAMDADNLDDLMALAPDEDARSRLRLLRDFDPAAAPGAEVPDPYYGGAADYDLVLDLADPAVQGLVARLAGHLG